MHAKRILFALLAVAALAAAPATQPTLSMADIEVKYRARADAVKRTYLDEMTRADDERLAELRALLSRATNTRDFDQAVTIKKRIDEIKSAMSTRVPALDANSETSALQHPGKENSFFGLNDEGKKVVYLCDESGSMLSVFRDLKTQLRNSINLMHEDEAFNVIFFSNDNCFPLFKDRPRPANAGNKKLASDFIDNAVATGGTQPLPAIKFALNEKPDLLFVLTDGFDQISKFDDVTGAFKNGNPDGKIRVDCIFLESDPDPRLEECLKKIASNPQTGFKKIQKSRM